MADINDAMRKLRAALEAQTEAAETADRERLPSEDVLLEVAELLFFAYRDFICEPDTILTEYGFGRAHHRVLHFVDRYPGLRVADLLEILQITKQSLGRVLKQLVDEGYIEQKAGQADRRERLLFTTPLGAELAGRLAEPQLERIAHSLDQEGDQTLETIREFLLRMVTEKDRKAVSVLLASAKPRGGDTENI